MEKLRLNLEELEVESFDTKTEPAGPPGTVFGMTDPYAPPSICRYTECNTDGCNPSVCGTCDTDCGQYSCAWSDCGASCEWTCEAQCQDTNQDPTGVCICF